MHRAWKRSLAAAAVAGVVLTPASSLAFHAGSLFDAPPGAGGGGGLFYTGAPRDKGWTCAACHIDAPGSMRVRLEVDPPLFDSFRYAPGQTYTVTARLDGETRGKDAPASNYNTIAISIVDANGNSVGAVSGFAAEDFYVGFPTTIVSTGQKPGLTSWTFQWTPPATGAGPVTFYLAAVDGDGAGRPSETLTDPFGDDLFVGTVDLQDGSATAAAVPRPRGIGQPGLVGIAFGLCLLGVRRGRRGWAQRA